MSGRPGFNPRSSYTKDLKMVLDISLLNTQHYKVRIKDKVEQSGEKISAPLHLGVVSSDKGAFESPSTTVANFTYKVACLKNINMGPTFETYVDTQAVIKM